MPEQTTEDRWKSGLVALVVGVASLLTAVLVGRLWPHQAPTVLEQFRIP
jgi:hypothetical protein